MRQPCFPCASTAPLTRKSSNGSAAPSQKTPHSPGQERREWCAVRDKIPCEICSHQGEPMREVIATPNAPKAIGPYSQAIKANGLIFTAGQIALDPASGTLVEGDVA